MQSSLNTPTAFNWITFSLGILLLMLTMGDRVRFGHGYGDALYLIAIGVCVVVHLILNLVLARPKRKGANWGVGIVFLIVYGFLFTK